MVMNELPQKYIMMSTAMQPHCCKCDALGHIKLHGASSALSHTKSKPRLDYTKVNSHILNGAYSQVSLNRIGGTMMSSTTIRPLNERERERL